MDEEKIIKINKRSFITVCVVLVFFMILSYGLTYIIPKGYFDENLTYIPLEGKGYPFLKFLISPFLTLGSESGISIIVISLFLLILSGSFNIIDKTKGLNSIIGFLVKKFEKRRYLLIYSIILVFMLFGALFGIFEESVTLLPIIVFLALAMGWDTFTGLSMCLLAAGFGFSSAITNPFSVGLGSTQMEINLLDGIWYRIMIFILMYIILCVFTKLHVRKIEKNPKSSITYETDQVKREKFNSLETITQTNQRTLVVYLIFFLSLFVIIILSSVIPVLQGYSIPIIAIAFLIGIFICGKILHYSFKTLGSMFFQGLVTMTPAIILLMLAGSIKFILDEGQIMPTIIHNLINFLDGTSPIMAILFIYFIILIIQFFIGSASAKVILLIPILAIMADKLGISRNIALLAFIFGDGYTDLIYPTNPVLLISLGMVSFSYIKWIKKTFLLQIIVLVLTILLLLLGYIINY